MRSFFPSVVLLAACAVTSPGGAVERIEEPLTFSHALNWKSGAAVSLGRLDMSKTGAEAQSNDRQGEPLRVAVVRKETSEQKFDEHGEWSAIDDMSVWRLKIRSEDATWLSFAFDDVFLPSGASLFIYDESYKQVLGPFTDQHNKPSRKLWTPMVEGDVAFVEINIPTRMKPFLSLDLKSVNHGYRSFKAASLAKAGACNIDVVCPQGDDWRDEIRSVARYVFARDGSMLTCTGNLVNNTSGDRKPYFLTANHCVGTVDEALSMVLYWNFEKSVCGGIADGSSMQAQNGATLLATMGSLDGPLPNRDMTLVELDSTPDYDFNVRWTGWDTDPVPPASGASIHHPDGSEKSISLDSGPITITQYLVPQQDPDGTHLKITAWDEGTTESGSSGSGFWNSERRLVGVLSGGSASCDNADGSDYYAHLASHYDIGSSSATRLKVWLDPDDTGATKLDGIDGCDVPPVSFTISSNPAEVGQPIEFTSMVAVPPGESYSYSWDFDGDGVSDSAVESPAFTYSSSYVGNVDLTVSSQSCSALSTAAIIVEPQGGNSAPIASAVASAGSADEGAAVQLSGSGSSDANGDTLTFSWSQTEGPPATFSSQTVISPTVTLPTITADTVVTFALTVTDKFGASDTDLASITVFNVNSVPTARVSPATLFVNEGSLVTLNAGTSSDDDGDSLSFSWVQSSGAAVGINNATSSAASFSAPQVTSSTALVFLVTVTDPSGLADTATVTVTVNNVVPPATGGGGGGTLGGPMILLLLGVLYLRRARRSLTKALALSTLALLAACGTSDPQPLTLPTVEQQTAPAADPVIVMTTLGARKSTARITDSTHVAQAVAALQNRERRYEKIKPLYEYEMRLNVDGKVEVWQLSSSGYVQKTGSAELYRMDMSALRNYMK